MSIVSTISELKWGLQRTDPCRHDLDSYILPHPQGRGEDFALGYRQTLVENCLLAFVL